MNGLSAQKSGRCREVGISRDSTINQIHGKGGLYPGGNYNQMYFLFTVEGEGLIGGSLR